MLSVLIPTFNYDCSELVEKLCQEGCRLQNGFELIVGDDASTDQAVISALGRLQTLPGVMVVHNSENLGRAAGRNQMARQSKGDILFFIDADALVPDDFSLQAGLDAIRDADVVCGGLRHPAVNPCPKATLRFKYEKEADKSRSAEIRSQTTYHQISTFSLMVRRDVFLSILFDEQCREYGYEDTLFGAELEKRGAKVVHIDNPLIHNGLEPNDVYLKKTEQALHTLKRLEPLMVDHSRLLQAVGKLRRQHLAWLAALVFKSIRRPLRRNLLGPNPSLKAFAFYKLGYFLTLKTDKHTES